MMQKTPSKTVYVVSDVMILHWSCRISGYGKGMSELFSMESMIVKLTGFFQIAISHLRLDL